MTPNQISEYQNTIIGPENENILVFKRGFNKLSFGGNYNKQYDQAII